MAHGDKPTVDLVVVGGFELPIKPVPDDWKLYGPTTSLPIASWRMVNGGATPKEKPPVDQIERVAKALFERWARRSGFSVDILYDKGSMITWEEATSSEYVQTMPDGFREEARVAISAMREPTNGMANAGTRCLALDWEITADGRVAPEVWTAMIDAALGA